MPVFYHLLQSYVMNSRLKQMLALVLVLIGLDSLTIRANFSLLVHKKKSLKLEISSVERGRFI